VDGDAPCLLCYKGSRTHGSGVGLIKVFKDYQK